MTKKRITIDDLAIIVQKGFEKTASREQLENLEDKFDKLEDKVDKMDARLDRMEIKFDRMEKIILEDMEIESRS